jgi:hypothetical protein
MMVLQHIVFLQFDSPPTACFRNIVQDDVVLITVATSAAYRLCYSSQQSSTSPTDKLYMQFCAIEPNFPVLNYDSTKV